MGNPRSFAGRALGDPAQHAAAVTPHDTDELAVWAEALYVGTSGNLVVVTWHDEEVTFTNVPVGVLPVSVKQVKSTGTTASNIVALW